MGEGRAAASVTGLAPAAKRVSSWPWRTLAGMGSAATSRVSASHGSGSGLATSTRLPNLRPRSTPGSAMRPTCGKIARAVATCARTCASGGPSATLTANTPVPLSTRRAAAANSAEVRWPGVWPPANTSAITTSNEPGRSRSSTSRASPIRIRTRTPRTGSLAPDQVDQRGVGVDGQLGRARPGGRDVPGQRQGPGAQVQHAQLLAGRCCRVDDVPQPPDVLEVQVARVVQVDVRLRDAVDQQHPRGRPVGVPQQLGATLGPCAAIDRVLHRPLSHDNQYRR